MFPLNNLQTGIGSFITFSEIQFAFRVSPKIMATGVVFALFMGAVGGLFPARSAAKRRYWRRCEKCKRAAAGMQDELKNLRIDRTKKSGGGPPRWAGRWIVAGVAVLLLLGLANFIYGWVNRGPEVDVVRVKAAGTGQESAEGGVVILNATGYIIAAHKIQVSSKVLGRVAWIGVERGDRVKEGQAIVRLEDDEYRAQLTQATGQVANLEARLAEMLNGSRPEEIARAKADLAQARADMVNALVTLDRTKGLVAEGVRQSIARRRAGAL